MKILHKTTGAILFDGDPSNLRGANLSRADLSGADLSGANLRGANLSRANLYCANLSGANLSGADLSGANLYGANLYGANLYCANLYCANLSGADLSGANLYGANLSRANLNGEILKKIPLVVTGLHWGVMVTNEYLTIGCQRHTHAAWAAFTDAEIAAMDRPALRFWRQWKAPLLAMCASHAAQ
jgi:uncharacterized protein YjbI with pentapeptide repeats